MNRQVHFRETSAFALVDYESIVVVVIVFARLDRAQLSQCPIHKSVHPSSLGLKEPFSEFMEIVRRTGWVETILRIERIERHDHLIRFIVSLERRIDGSQGVDAVPGCASRRIIPSAEGSPASYLVQGMSLFAPWQTDGPF